MYWIWSKFKLIILRKRGNDNNSWLDRSEANFDNFSFDEFDYDSLSRLFDLGLGIFHDFLFLLTCFRIQPQFYISSTVKYSLVQSSKTRFKVGIRWMFWIRFCFRSKFVRQRRAWWVPPIESVVCWAHCARVYYLNLAVVWPCSSSLLFPPSDFSRLLNFTFRETFKILST